MPICGLEIIFRGNNIELRRRLNLDFQRNFEAFPFFPDLQVHLTV